MNPMQIFKQYAANVAKLNGSDDPKETFSIVPTIHTRMENAIRDSSQFLQNINSYEVVERTGAKILFDINGPVTGRTDTSGPGERAPKDVENTTDDQYTLNDYEADVFLAWQRISQMARFPDFATRYRKAVSHQIALDRINIMWNGTSIAATSTDPNLMDVDKGFIQKTLEARPENIVSEIKAASNIIKLGSAAVTSGATADGYKNLDSLVADQKTLIPFNKRSDLIVIVSENLLSNEEGKLYDAHGRTPTEKLVVRQSLQSYGALPTYIVPGYPDNCVTVTKWTNLSWYYQKGQAKRSIADNHKKKRVEDLNFFVGSPEVEDFDLFTTFKNITIADV